MSLLRNPSVVAAMLGHFSVDMYSGMLPLILLALTDPLGLSYTQVGLVSMAFSISSSLSQPIFGWIGDRQHNRWIAVLGVAGIALTMGSLRFVDGFSVLFALALMAGLGSGAFHPQGATLAARTTPETRGTAMSIYMLGGNVGYAFGPMFAGAAFALTGGYMPEAFAVVGLAQAGLVYWALTQSHAASRGAIKVSTVRAATAVIVTLGLVIFMRSWVQTSIQTFIPQVYKAQGFSTGFAANVLFSFLMPAAIGGLVGGTLSDRIGRKRVLVVSTALSAPLLWGFLNAGESTAYLWGVMLGFVAGASSPVTLVMAQELIPRGLGLMSGFVLGFTFISGAIGVSINGVFADQIGLLPTMGWNVFVPLGAAALALLLPNDEPVRQLVRQPRLEIRN